MSLLERIRAVVHDDREIATILRDAAGGAERATRSGSVEFLTGGSSPQLFVRLRYSGGVLVSLLPGQPLKSATVQAALVQRAAADGGRSHGTFIARRVLFSQIPLKGSRRWRNSFQISPCPKRARVGRGLDWAETGWRGVTDEHRGPPFPLVLEVRVAQSPNPIIEGNRVMWELDRVQQLLTLLLHGRVQYAFFNSDKQWISVKRRGRVEYHLLHAGFDAGVNGRDRRFLRSNAGPLPVFSGTDYYNHLWGADEELHVPESLDSDLAFFDGLPTVLRQRFQRACYWYSLGVQFAKERSLSTVAFSTAIECLLPRPSTEPCVACGKPRGAGPTKLFLEHLNRYGTVPESLVSRRAGIYGARSALVHGSYAARTDEGFLGSGDAFVDGLLVEIVAQRSLIGWLRDTQRRC